MALHVQSTRLFPEGQGADAYRITGIAARCDWVVLSDRAEPQRHLHRNVETDAPRHIFLSMRQPYFAIRFFCFKVLPLLTRPFVLVSGSGDATVPNQTDRRWRAFDDVERGLIAALLDNPLLLGWVAENLDEAAHDKLHPMPLGMVFRTGDAVLPDLPDLTEPPPEARPGRVLCAHRLREGPQWEPRRIVSDLARGPWASFCTLIETELSEAAYFEQLRQHRFVLCVEGGGLDPAPKTWHAMLHGCIPIARATPLQAAYAELPVGFVPRWEAEVLDAGRLDAIQRDIAARFGSDRAGVLARLGIDHWWQKIAALADGGRRGHFAGMRDDEPIVPKPER